MEDDLWKNISDEAKDFIKCMLEVDPKDRITTEKALDHKWFHVA